MGTEGLSNMTINIPGRDFIQIEKRDDKTHVVFRACHEFTALMNLFKKNFGVDISTWPIPKGNNHSEILIREMILKLQGKWDYPYKDEELCHCRHVSTQTIDEAILNGAHSSELVSLWTGSSTACGTCKPDVEKIINYRIVSNIENF